MGVGLAGFAGAVGTTAWLNSSEWYVTFMTGNSAMSVAEHFEGHHMVAFQALMLVAAFASGSFIAALASLR